MHGPDIFVRSLSVPGITDKTGQVWQYHPQSDRHSKILCWGLLFDLLAQSSVLQRQMAEGSVVFGVNHEMRDFETGRRKNLDLVLARPGSERLRRPRHLARLGQEYGVRLSHEESAFLSALPEVTEGTVGSVLIAVEAKAAMTAHQRALPRLYDELNSSHLTVHGASSEALAVGVVTVNACSSFVSPKLNKTHGQPVRVSEHDQPRDVMLTLAKIRELPRRTKSSQHGYDALGVIVFSCANDGSAIQLITGSPALRESDDFHYDMMVRRVAHEYEAKFSYI